MTGIGGFDCAGRDIRLGLLAIGILVLGCRREPPGVASVENRNASPTPADVDSPRSSGPFRFTDVSEESGIDWKHVNGAAGRRHLPETMGGSAAWLDIDVDGDFDLFLGQSGQIDIDAETRETATNGLFRNDGQGRFTDITARSGDAERTGYGQGVAVGDCDGDGRTDLYVTNYGPNVLLRNEPDSVFRDVTAAAGVGDPAWSCSAAFFDKDADGDLDLYVANYVHFSLADYKKVGDGKGYPAYPHPDNFKAARDTLYENRGDGTFLDVTVAAGIVDVDGKGLGVVPADLDRDGDLDLYVANDSTPNFTFENNGGKFVDRILSSNAGYNRDGVTEAGMGVTAGDVDGDLLPDIFVTNLDSETNTLYVNQGGLVFEDLTDLRGLARPSLGFVGFGTSFLDLDHDGDLDLLVANGHIIDNITTVRRGSGVTYAQRMLLQENDGRGRFQDVVAELPPVLLEPRVARALAVCDYDDDGDYDLAIAQNGARAVLIRNDCERSGTTSMISVRDKTGRTVRGAWAESQYGSTRRYYLSQAYGSYCAAGDPRIQVSAPVGVLDRLTIGWVTGERLELENVELGRAITVDPGGILAERR